jgi:hypothetical protein
MKKNSTVRVDGNMIFKGHNLTLGTESGHDTGSDETGICEDTQDLAREIYSLERFAERSAIIPESKKLRHLLLGQKSSTYRII